MVAVQYSECYLSTSTRKSIPNTLKPHRMFLLLRSVELIKLTMLLFHDQNNLSQTLENDLINLEFMFLECITDPDASIDLRNTLWNYPGTDS